jgi:hypothetical protein
MGRDGGAAQEPRAFTVHLCNTSFLYPVDDFAEVPPSLFFVLCSL